MLIYIILFQIRNFFIKPFFHYGPTIICYKDSDGLYKNFTVGKMYYSERRDYVSYYVKDDSGVLQEMIKTRFKLITKIK